VLLIISCGSDGKDGASCEIKALTNAENDFEVFCDGVSVGFLNSGASGAKGETGETGGTGEKGEAGEIGGTGEKGEAGETGGTGGKGEAGETGGNGVAGTTCLLEEPGIDAPANAAWEIFCGTVSVGFIYDGQVGADGRNGAGCDVVDAGANFVMTCGEVQKTWAKAICGATAYDPAAKFCVGATLYDKCGGNMYSPTSQVCFDDRIFATFTDSRNGQRYRIVTIGTQTWMAENLNFNASGSVCNDNIPANCNIYGRLYDWATAMAGAASSNTNPSGVRGVCPAGWHLPSDAEWTVLTNFAGGVSTAGTRLKAKSGWSGINGNGTDNFGFSALPGGDRSTNGSFDNVGTYGYWWTATESGSNAFNRDMGSSNENVDENSSTKALGFSVRCVQD
jgi:uncharacterized protein (TIGR02145 family)